MIVTRWFKKRKEVRVKILDKECIINKGIFFDAIVEFSKVQRLSCYAVLTSEPLHNVDLGISKLVKACKVNCL